MSYMTLDDAVTCIINSVKLKGCFEISFPVSTIHAVYNVAEVRTKQLAQADKDMDYGIVYAYVTTLDLDGKLSSVVAVKW